LKRNTEVYLTIPFEAAVFSFLRIKGFCYSNLQKGLHLKKTVTWFIPSFKPFWIMLQETTKLKAPNISFGSSMLS
jgi:hypothetical protein